MAAAFVKHIGSATGNEASLNITVPAGGAAAGNVLIVRAGSSITTKAITGITDSRGNTYADIQSIGTSANSGMLWRSDALGTALQAADTITISFTNKQPYRVAIDEFSGLDTTEDGKTAAQGSSTTPSAAITPANATDLVVTALFIEEGAGEGFTEDADTDGGAWASLTTVSATHALRGAYKITTSATTQTYDPTLGTSRAWTDIIAALQATAEGGAPAVLRSGMFPMLGVT